VAKKKKRDEGTASEPPGMPVLAWALGVGLSILVFFLYVRTLYPSLSPVGDAAELSTAAWIPGIAHPPGYPLYTMIGFLFARAEPGNPAHAMNLMSAFFGALGTLLSFLITMRLTGNTAASAAAALFLSFSPTAWKLSVTAEVFTLHLFLGLLIVYLMVTWFEDPQRRGAYLAASYFVMGLALSHHHTIILLAPALVYLQIAREGPKRFFAFLPKGALLIIAGLAPYLYLHLRSSDSLPLNWGDPSTLQGFLWTVSRTGYGTGTLFPGSSTAGAHGAIPALGDLFENLAASPCRCFALLAPLGLIFLFIKNRIISIFLIALFAGAGPLFLILASPPQSEGYRALTERFYLLPLSFWIIPMGAALDFFQKILKAQRHREVFGHFAVLLALIPLLLSYGPQDRSGNYTAADYAHNLLGGLPPKALLVATTDLGMGCAYYGQNVLKERPDVLVVNRGFLSSPWYLRQLESRAPGLVPRGSLDGDANLRAIVQKSGCEIFFDDYVKEYGRRLVPWGVCYRLLPSPAAAPADTLRAHLDRLLAFRATSPLNTRFYNDWFSLEVARRYARASFNLGWALDRMGETTQALEAYRLSARQDPSNAMTWDNLGHVCRRTGKLAEAERAFKTSLSLREHPMSYCGLALVYMQMGKIREAQEMRSKGDALRGRHLPQEDRRNER
jgi:tetratricopeptide (TPR) repeat protein